MNKFNDFQIDSIQLSSIKGGGEMSSAEFLKVTNWLFENGHYDQLVEVMKMVNNGTLTIVD
ncbi:MAG: hypothetical protein KBH01_03055 [Breznakibacter sp.]|jgi:hypothetical protein|nr:hypothetical protein [Breznakibacter sp.]